MYGRQLDRYEKIVVNFKHKLIISNTQESDLDGSGKYIASERTTYTSTIIWRTAVSAFFLLGVAIPSGAHAGVISDILSSISTYAYAGEQQTNNKSAVNSQTLTLLSAANNIDPNPSKGGAEITITDDAALLASSGPSGTMANVENSDMGALSKHVGLYIVRSGDTLSEISKMFNVSINTIRWANDIGRRGTIHPGQELIILPMTGIKYTIKRGGTLRDIVKIYGGDIDEAVEYNDLDADKWLAKGTEVIIPDGELQLKEPVNSWRAKRKYSRKALYVKGSNSPEYKGYYMRPLISGIKTQGLHGYNAVDIGAPIDTPLLASASGRVIRAKYSGWNSGYGRYLLIQHDNGTQTLYAHTNSVVVSVGQKVVQGQVIAYVGSTGRSTGPHVHFEIRGAKNPF